MESAIEWLPLVPRDPRFWRKVDASGDCWLWIGAINGNGYGFLSRHAVSPSPILAHRYSWRLAHGPIPDGLSVLHRCDNPPCVRPSHLFLGTNLDNVRDRDAKGRGSKPPMNWHGLCKRGHPLTPSNRERVREGSTTCRICRRAARLRAHGACT